MNTIFGEQGAERYRQLKTRVWEFRGKYLAYCENPSAAARSELMQLLPLTEEAYSVAGMQPPQLCSPLGDVAVGVTSVALAFENPRFVIAHGERERIMQLTLDVLDMAMGALTEHERVAAEREGTFGYKAQKVAQGVLGFPIRIIGWVGGFKPEELSDAKARLSILTSAGGYAGAAYGVIRALGSKFGWW